MTEIVVGCCGFCTSMNKYFREYMSIEIQKTFYKPPRVETAKKWRNEADKVNKNFEFTLKAWQVITHPPSSPTYNKVGLKLSNCGYFKLNSIVIKAWEKTREIAKVLKAKVIVFQTPFSFKDNDTNIKRIVDFFSTIEDKFTFVWEARGWNREKVKEVCKKVNLIHCVDPMVEDPVLTGEISYFRLHGHSPKCRDKPIEKLNYRHVYTKEELKWLKKYIMKYKNRVYVMFNNTNMCADAKKFESLLKI